MDADDGEEQIVPSVDVVEDGSSVDVIGEGALVEDVDGGVEVAEEVKPKGVLKFVRTMERCRLHIMCV